MMAFIKRHPIKLVLVALVLSKILHLMITADPPGYCSSEPYTSVKNRYLSDEEFVEAFLRVKFLHDLSQQDDHYGKNQAADEGKVKQLVANYLARNPNCCKVFRGSTRDIEVHSDLWDRSFWHFQTVAVTLNGESGYAVMSVCGRYLGAN